MISCSGQPCAMRPRMNSTASRVPRITGLPTRTAGSAVIYSCQLIVGEVYNYNDDLSAEKTVKICRALFSKHRVDFLSAIFIHSDRRRPGGGQTFAGKSSAVLARSLLFFFRLFLFFFFGDWTRLPAPGNKQVRQRILEVRGSRGGGLALPEVKALKIGQALQVLETGITHRGAVKIQIGQ